MSITEQDYEARALPELRALVDAIDELELPGLECELSSDILTLELSNGDRYVVNSHRAARQIWMAADRNAWHFDWDDARTQWVAKKTGDELWSTLSRLLSAKLGKGVSLSRA
ncbi:MAG TPA: iron donor protein CyaY [Polyangiaceae bacterium]|nr:iron donor protein CyaY [Polyangiaceae bacterium]